jgi:hypothetical protein
MAGDPVQLSPMMSYAETRDALLGGSPLTPVRDARGEVTHYEVVFPGRPCSVATFAARRHLVEELAADRWGLSARGRYRTVAAASIL